MVFKQQTEKPATAAIRKLAKQHEAEAELLALGFDCSKLASLSSAALARLFELVAAESAAGARRGRQKWGIWCSVFGVTGQRSAWMKSNGRIVEFATLTEAEETAAENMRRVAGNPRASFRYVAKPFD
jgi:hypothetical protein